MTKQTLEQRIAAILTNDNASAAELSELIREAESAAQTADQDAETERTKAIDIVQSPNAEAAQRAVAEAILARERLRASLKKMRAKLSEASRRRKRKSAGWSNLTA